MATKKNPVDDYLSRRAKTAADRNARDHELWNTWKTSPSPQTLQPLLQRYEPVFTSKVKQWKAPNVSESAFRGSLVRQAIKAFETYDPNRGASLNTHVNNLVKKTMRFNTRAQNMANIPEDKATRIGKIDSARDHLYDTLGRDPTDAEVGAHLGIKPTLVTEIGTLRRADIQGSAFESDPVGHSASRDQEVISLLRPALTPDEQVVYDYTYGFNGTPVITSTNEIARRTGKSPSQISRLKSRIAAKYKKYV